MIEVKQIGDLRRRCLKAVTAVHDIDTLERIVPIAFPVYKSTWKIRLRIEKATGLVDRHILTAVKRFGPISAQGISELMGLESDVIERSLIELFRAGVELRQEGLNWSLSANEEIRHFYVEQDHNFAFLSNGLTGNFLPLAQTEAMKSATLGEDDIKRLRLVTMKHIRSSAECDLMKQIGSSDRSHCFVGYGIPDGFVGFSNTRPESEFAGFVLAFLFAFSEGQFEILSASESAFQFECPKTIAQQYLKRLGSENIAKEKVDGIDYVDKGNCRKLTVRDENLWINDINPESATAQGWRLLRRMTYPGWYCDLTGRFYQLIPGDEKTAYRLAIMRGCSLLRRSYARIRTERDLEKIAVEYLDECAREFPTLKKCPDFAEVLCAAAESNDGNVAEIARQFDAKKFVVTNTGRGTVRFLYSQGPAFHDAIIGAIDAAKISIMIMSPVLNDEGIFNALERARARGVRDISVITQLIEHRNNVFKSDPQFFDYELPRRRLSALGIGVRDCSHTVHAKLIIVDSSWAFVTSANLNANSLGVGQANAIEVALEYKDIVAARVAETLFSEIWNSACYRQVRTDDRISITSNASAREIKIESCSLAMHGYSFILSTPENQLLARKISSLIHSARKRVDIVTMSFYDLLEVPCVFGEIMSAMKRGVKIRVCVRPGEEMNFSRDVWPDPSTKKLQKAGLELHQTAHLHAKGMVADGKKVLMTSANFNQFSLGCSRTAHIEMAVAGLTDQEPLAAFAKFVDRAIKGK